MSRPKQTCFINGLALDWAGVEIEILGRVLEGIDSFTLNFGQNKTKNWGRGSKSVTVARANQDHQFELVLQAEEFSAIEAQAVAQGLDGVHEIPPFPVSISYFSADGKQVSYRIAHCEFALVNTSASQGDSKIAVTCPMMIGEVKRVA